MRLAESMLVALTVAVGTACGAGGGAEPAEPPPEGAWRLVSGSGPSGTVAAPATHPITLRFESGQVAGTAACNSYGGPVRFEGDRIELGGFSVTEMACEPDVMAAEAAYVDALGRVGTFRRDGDRLVLAGPSVELAFDPEPPVERPSLAGTRWELESLLRGETASSVPAPAALRFDPDGTLSGETGCRAFHGRWPVRGAEVVLPRLEVVDDPTAGACPPAVDEQERLVLEVLGDGFRAEVEGGRLTLTSGDLGLVYRAR